MARQPSTAKGENRLPCIHVNDLTKAVCRMIDPPAQLAAAEHLLAVDWGEHTLNQIMSQVPRPQPDLSPAAAERPAGYRPSGGDERRLDLPAGFARLSRAGAGDAAGWVD